MTSVAEPTTGITCAFLTTPAGSADVFSPERMTEEQRLIAQTARAFVDSEVRPRREAISHQEELEGAHILRTLLGKAGELGLLMADVPEAYGGLEAGLTVSTMLADLLSADASFSVAVGAQTTIGSLPIVYFGNEAQKAKYLPGLATGELVSAYCLTEPGTGSDAMNIKTRAALDAGGTHYLINGGKQWISNAGFADVLIVFAKIDDSKFTAFIVESSWPGVSLGAEEKKMGIKGSSTRSVYFDNVRVPVVNVLGEIGKGHKIAFNILNVGRLKLGAGGASGGRNVLALATPYSRERRAFGKPIGDFGLIRQKLAAIAAEAYAAESLVYRAAGLMEGSVHARPESPTAGLEEFAIEASISKVFGSEVLAFAVDEGVQIFGGYGFMQEYPIEGAYRDARISRIFEGTNEINRLLISGTLFRRAMEGRVPLMDVYADIETRVNEGTPPPVAVEGDLHAAADALERAKHALIVAAMKGVMPRMSRMEEEQEFLASVADGMINIFAVDSAITRAVQSAKLGHRDAAHHSLAARLATFRLLPRVRTAIEQILLSTDEGDELTADLALLNGYAPGYLVNGVALGREMSDLVVARNGYPFPLGR
ncbi:MAG: acyl-CoA dehydrogenase [Chloroflexi bacterium]|nr:acyl-CoA dehydrogenase [Chloroflexota bacterium]